MRWVPLVLVACASPPPQIIQETTPPKPPPPPPARVSCADAGTILRGAVEDSRKAGPAKEAALASACMFDRWSQPILDCIGTSQDPHACLAELTADQRSALDTKMQAWIDIYTDETWEMADDETLGLGCADVIGDVATYAPPLAVTGEDREFAIKLRRPVVLAQCERWPHPVRKCIQTKGSQACRAQLAPDVEATLVRELAVIDALMARVATAKQKPHDCKAVVAAHYSDAAWRGKAELPKNPKATRAELAKQATERKRLISESRKRMLDACTGEAWSATVRACELAAGGELCSRSLGKAARWTFPAVGVVSMTGVPECDAYSQSIQQLLACDKFPTQSKDAVNQGFQTMLTMIHQAKPDELPGLTQSCKAGNDAIRQALTAVGCP